MGCSALGSGVQNAMTNVASLVQTLPTSSVPPHIVVVTFVLRRHRTNIHIEIQALEGGGMCRPVVLVYCHFVAFG